MQRIVLPTALILALAFTCAPAQEEESRRGPGRFGGGPDRLAAAGLAVGQSLPPLDVYDADGRPFEQSQLQGHYVVVVFGCLT